MDYLHYVQEISSKIIFYMLRTGYFLRLYMPFFMPSLFYRIIFFLKCQNAYSPKISPPGTYAKRFRGFFLPNPARTENGCFTVSGILSHRNRAYSQHIAPVSAICEKPARSDKTNPMIIHAVNQLIPFDKFPIISLCIANYSTGRQSAFRYVAECKA